jgi:hypothetical protein
MDAACMPLVGISSMVYVSTNHASIGETVNLQSHIKTASVVVGKKFMLCRFFARRALQHRSGG